MYSVNDMPTSWDATHLKISVVGGGGGGVVIIE